MIYNVLAIKEFKISRKLVTSDITFNLHDIVHYIETISIKFIYRHVLMLLYVYITSLTTSHSRIFIMRTTPSDSYSKMTTTG